MVSFPLADLVSCEVTSCEMSVDHAVLKIVAMVTKLADRFRLLSFRRPGKPDYLLLEN